MLLATIKNKNAFKKELSSFIDDFFARESQLKLFVSSVLENGDIYIVGGFVRDFINGKPSRDIDIITVASEEQIGNLVKALHINYTKNRHNGYKLSFHEIEMDIWSIADNWAFKKNYVKSNREAVRSIARGTFYNYDSLVFAYKTKKISVDYYNNCVKNNTLDILQKNSKYRGYNPTREANILRAFFLHEKHNLFFSENLAQYIRQHLSYFQIKYSNPISRLKEYLEKYPKYEEILTDEVLEECCNRMITGDGFMIASNDDENLPKLF